MKPDAHFERLAISRYEEIKALRQRINELATDWQVMHTKLAACEKDAKRYRWLRTLDPRKYTDLWMYCLNHDVRFDEQVDEAMKK